MSNPHVIFIHGFNVSDNGASTVGHLVPHFAALGCSTEILSYGHFNIFEPRLKNRKIAEELTVKVRAASRPVIVVAHSNGCAITHMCEAPIDKAVFISAALNSDAEFPPNIGAVDVWHSRKDWVLRLAKLLPLHKWGDMGRVGATRYDRRVKNFDRSQNFDHPSAWHSDVFKAPLVDYFGPIIAKEALCRLPS